MLQIDSQFAGYHVVGKLSTHHDGEREVYLARDSEGKDVALVVYNLMCDRYHDNQSDSGNEPKPIKEVKICSSLRHKCFPKIIAQGVEECGSNRLAWTAQEYFKGNSLADEMRLQQTLSLTDTVRIARQLTDALCELSDRTGGGGHYDLRPDNIIVEYDLDELKDVHITGMTSAGEPTKGNFLFRHDYMSSLYRAPETLKGIFNQTSDIYSIGMMMLVMLLGEKVTERYIPDSEGAEVDTVKEEEDGNLSWRTPSEWNKAVWAFADNELASTTRPVLHKATSTNALTRIPTMHKLSSYIQMLEKKLPKGSPAVKESAEPSEASSERLSVETGRTESKVDFSDLRQDTSHKGLDEVAGMQELKKILRRNFVDIVKNRQMAKTYGITPPNGILLYGAPGCGKTFVAEKAAQESGLKYRILNPSDFGSIYVHGSQGKIAETFKEAEKNAPIILILDEFDAMVPRRDSEHNNQANEVNEILTQMNNCASKGIFVLATTNRPDMIDAACLRAGRMDEKVYVGLPDADARKEIFKMELMKRPCEEDIDLELLGNSTADYTCGDISYIVKETARRCFDETIRNGDGNAVPLTTARLLDVAKTTVPSVSPKDIRHYQELKDKMEHRDKENRTRGRVGFSSNI